MPRQRWRPKRQAAWHEWPRFTEGPWPHMAPAPGREAAASQNLESTPGTLGTYPEIAHSMLARVVRSSTSKSTASIPLPTATATLCHETGLVPYDLPVCPLIKKWYVSSP